MVDSGLLLIQAAFGLAFVSHLILLLIAPKAQANLVGRMLLVAIGGEIFWSLANLSMSLGYQSHPAALYLAEAVRAGGWAAFLTSLLRTLPAAEQGPGWLQKLTDRNFQVVAGVGVLLFGIVSIMLLQWGLPNRRLVAINLVLSILLLVALEQVWRNADPSRRWSIKFLTIALFLKFGLDVAIYSNALLFNQLEIEGWILRGFLNSLLVPLIAVAAVRNTDWRLSIGVSREVVFYSATLLLCGGFLLAFAVGGYYLRTFGGNWTGILTASLAFTVLASALLIASSGAARARLRVFIAKNFFTYRYNYREEWLRLAQLIATPQVEQTDGQPNPNDSLTIRAIEGIGRLVESTGGAIWLRPEPSGHYRCEGVLNRASTLAPIHPDAELIQFCARHESIIDLQAGAPNHENWQQAFLPTDIASDPNAVLLVPLKVGDEVIGLVLLDSLRINFPMNWEVYDMLKIAGRLVASYVAVRQSTEALLMAREFDTFNRMSAFVVHDMKNQVSQLSLILNGAEKHGQDPEYQKDVIETVREVFQQMQDLLLQLTTQSASEQAGAEQQSVDLIALLEGAVKRHRRADLEAQPVYDQALIGVSVDAEKERLDRAIGNLIQNAIDATPATGRVTVTLKRSERPNSVEVVISDTGQGMTESFIRNRLFKPFTSTKANGMGVGAFEAREYIRHMGGSLDVSSRPGEGSSFRVELPLRSNSG